MLCELSNVDHNGRDINYWVEGFSAWVLYFATVHGKHGCCARCLDCGGVLCKGERFVSSQCEWLVTVVAVLCERGCRDWYVVSLSG